MNRQMKPRWHTLTVSSLVLGAALLLEVRLPLSPAGQTWLLVLWVLLFYGALSLWIAANREALERAPRPRDVVGRPIIDVDAPEIDQFVAKKEEAGAWTLAQPFRQSEAM